MKTTYLFPGQGSQVVGMGRDFYHASNIAKEMFEQASDVLKIDTTWLLFEENDKLNQTEFSQPAILLVSLIANRLFRHEVEFTYALGHSLGELSSLVSVGAIDFQSAISLVHQRGLLMKKACEGKNAGMMAVIGLEQKDLEALVQTFQDEGKNVWIANINNETQIVLAGTQDDLQSVSTRLKEQGAKRALLLPMSVASHCPLLKDAQTSFEKLLIAHIQDNFKSPIISNVTALPYSSKQEAISLLTKQLVSPVLYTKSIHYCEQKSDIFIEFGGNVLKGLNRRITKKPTYSITDMQSLESCIDEISQFKKD